VIEMRTSALLVAIGLIVLQPVRVSAQWWSRAPADFEECADAAEKAATKEDKTAALAECNAKFAGRRKPGGGYTYYDFMQDRTFDIAGPNPTPEEQRYIDQQYTLYLENQRRSSVAAALTAQQQQQLQPPPIASPQQPPVQQASLKNEPELQAPQQQRVPLPITRPTKQQQARARAAYCAKNEFSCNWPKLSEGINGLKKLFSGPAPQTTPPTRTAKRG
jgi:hypothetical protein